MYILQIMKLNVEIIQKAAELHDVVSNKWGCIHNIVACSRVQLRKTNPYTHIVGSLHHFIVAEI